MATRQSSRYCPICRRRTLHSREVMPAGWGCLLTVLTCGLYLIVWLANDVGNLLGFSRPPRCQTCGRSDPTRRNRLASLIVWAAIILVGSVILIAMAASASGCTCACPPPEPSRRITARTFRVLRVIDGDTYTIMYDGEETSVRIWGIDAPELREPGGPEARDVLASHIEGRIVTLAFPGRTRRDNFGRLLASIIETSER